MIAMFFINKLKYYLRVRKSFFLAFWKFCIFIFLCDPSKKLLIKNHQINIEEKHFDNNFSLTNKYVFLKQQLKNRND